MIRTSLSVTAVVRHIRRRRLTYYHLQHRFHLLKLFHHRSSPFWATNSDFPGWWENSIHLPHLQNAFFTDTVSTDVGQDRRVSTRTVCWEIHNSLVCISRPKWKYWMWWYQERNHGSLSCIRWPCSSLSYTRWKSYEESCDVGQIVFLLTVCRVHSDT